MTINFFLQSKDLGGAEIFAKDLLLELARSKQKIRLYTSNPFLLKNIFKKQQISLQKIPIYIDFAGNVRGLIKSLLLSPLALVYYWFELAKIRNKGNDQVVICSGFSEKIFLSPIAHFYNLPIIFIEYGPLEPLFRKLFAIPKILYSFAQKFVDQVIVSSNKTKNSLSEIYPQEKMQLIRCGSPDLLSRKQIQRTKKTTVTIISRLEIGKGQDLAIKAWQKIKRKPKNAELLIVGRGSYEKKLRQMAAADNSIQFLPYADRVEEILNCSQISLCPSVWELEGFGLVVTEAMALSKPIITFDRAPYNELLRDHYNALLAKDGSPNDLAKKIEQLLNDEDLQKKLSKQARLDYLNNFQISEVAQNYLALITKVLAIKNAV